MCSSQVCLLCLVILAVVAICVIFWGCVDCCLLFSSKMWTCAFLYSIQGMSCAGNSLVRDNFSRESGIASSKSSECQPRGLCLQLIHVDWSWASSWPAPAPIGPTTSCYLVRAANMACSQAPCYLVRKASETSPLAPAPRLYNVLLLG